MDGAGQGGGMDENREYREVDEATFDRYVRYAFRPTAGPPDEGGGEDGSGAARRRTSPTRRRTP